MPGSKLQPGVSLEEMLAGAYEPEGEAAAPVLVFGVDGAWYAVDATQVEVIVPAPPIAPLPFPPDRVLGVASVRGRMRLVVDPGGARIESSPRLIVLHGEAHLALLADHVLGVFADGEREAIALDPETLVTV